MTDEEMKAAASAALTECRNCLGDGSVPEQGVDPRFAALVECERCKGTGRHPLCVHITRLLAALRERDAEVARLRGLGGAIADVSAFHGATDTPIARVPSFPSDERRLLRMSLIREEFGEYMAAEATHDLPEVADAFADLIYVIVGAALEYGIPLNLVWAEVQRTNMAKADPVTGKVVKRGDGKIIKPPGWEAPDIAGILARATATAIDAGPERA